MNLVVTVLEVVTPVFILAGVGFAWARAGFEYRVAFITQLATTLTVPCLVFVSLMKAEIDPGALTSVTFAALAGHFAILFASWAFLRLAGIEVRTFLLPMLFGNTGNLGLPLALFAFGDEGLSLAVVVFAVSAILTFTVGLGIVAGNGGWARMWREPLIWATILGAVFLWNDWEAPKVITRSVELIGQMAIPMMLLTLGVAVARLKPAGMGRALALSLVKLVITFGLGWVVAWGFGLTGTAFSVVVLQLATPVAVTSYLLTEKYEGDAEAVAGMVVISTLISVAALPLILAVLL